MVLRSGIILPFIYRDTKKLLMVGEKKENRDLSLWDLKNVVRAAFGIYNFEFRNKKIGFNIPDELLLHYLAQRHDLTNFVIEIGQAEGDIINADSDEKMKLSMETSGPHNDIVQPPLKSNGSTNDDHSPQHYPLSLSDENVATTPLGTVSVINETLNESSDTPNSAQKIRSHHFCDSDTTDTLTQQSLHPLMNQIIPKAEHAEDMRELRDGRYEIRRQTMLHHQQMHLQQQQQQQYTINQTIQQQSSSEQHNMSTPTTHSFSNFSTQSILGNHDTTIPPPTPQPQQYSPGLMNRFRRRGERMSKDQKELYVKYFEENPCMLSNRRNDHLLEPHWNKLANMLNSIPQGAAKNVEEWKQTFDAWRYRVFMYTRYNSKLAGPAAQNPKNYKPLTPTDQRAYAMWTSHKSTTPQDYDKIDMFANLDDTQADYSYS